MIECVVGGCAQGCGGIGTSYLCSPRHRRRLWGVWVCVRVQGAFLNDRPIRVSGVTSVGNAVVMNNIGASRDGDFVRKTLNRLEVLLEHKVQVSKRMLGVWT